MQHKKLYTILMLMGAFPFLFGAAAPYFGLFELPLIGSIQNSVAWYGLAIVSFMAGVHWGLSLLSITDQQPTYARPMCVRRMMLASNVYLIVPWFSLAALGVGVTFYFSLAVALVLILLTDHRLLCRGLLSGSYYRMRLIVTAIVVPCLVSLSFTVSY